MIEGHVDCSGPCCMPELYVLGIKGGSSLESSKLKTGIYVASRALPERVAMWLQYRDQFHFPVISSWIDQAGLGESDYTQLWPLIMEEIRSCTALVLYARKEDFPLKGAFVEVGAALVLGKPVYVVLPHVVLEPRTFRPVGSWMNHPNVTQCEHLADAFVRSRERAV